MQRNMHEKLESRFPMPIFLISNLNIASLFKYFNFLIDIKKMLKCFQLLLMKHNLPKKKQALYVLLSSTSFILLSHQHLPSDFLWVAPFMLGEITDRLEHSSAHSVSVSVPISISVPPTPSLLGNHSQTSKC